MQSHKHQTQSQQRVKPHIKETKNHKSVHHESQSDISRFYETILEQTLQKARKGGSFISHLGNELHKDLSALNQLSKEEFEAVKAYIQRDLSDVAHYVNSSGKTLKDWLGFDIALIESKLMHNFAEAADKTTLELLKLRDQGASQAYHTGESAGIGTLQCDACGAKLHFHRPARIPPCAKCHHTEFHREAA